MLVHRVKIRTKLLLGLIAIGALVVSTAAVVISRQSVVRRSFEIHDRMLTIERFLLECRRQEKNFLLREDDASAPLFEESLRSLLAEIDALRSDSVEPAVAARLSDLEVAAAAYADAFRTTSGPAWFRADGQERDRLEAATVEAARRCHTVTAGAPPPGPVLLINCDPTVRLTLSCEDSAGNVLQRHSDQDQKNRHHVSPWVTR